MRLDREARGDGVGGAEGVGVRVVGGEEELVAGFEGVGEGGWGADCEAKGVAVPVRVWRGGVADWGVLVSFVQVVVLGVLSYTPSSQHHIYD